MKELRESTIMNKTRELIKLMNVHLNHFPQHEKFGLSLAIRNCAYEMYALIIECWKRYQNKTTLRQLDVKHEQLRMFLNLAFELEYYHFDRTSKTRSDSEALRRYTAISCLVNEVGAMIGGWIRSSNHSNEVLT